MLSKKEKKTQKKIQTYLKSGTFQRLLIAAVTIMMAFILVQAGATPKKYKLNEGEKSLYNIDAPRDIENKIKTEQNRQAAYNRESQVYKELSSVPIEVLNSTDNFFEVVDSARYQVQKSLDDQGITKKSKNYRQRLEVEQAIAAKKLAGSINEMGVLLSNDQVQYLIIRASNDDITFFRKITKELIGSAMKEAITQDDLGNKIDKVQTNFQNTLLSQELKNIGGLLVKAVLKPNTTIDAEQTEVKKMEAYNDPVNMVKILKDSRIISYGDIVTKDKLAILEDLNLLQTKSRFDLPFSLGILAVLLLLAGLLILFMKHFSGSTLSNRKDVVLLCVILVLILIVARGVGEYYTPLAIPIFMATMLISILINLQTATAVNCILAIAISIMVKGDLRFLYMAIISGCFSAFFVSRANQRSKLSMAGLIVGFINVLIIACLGIINRGDFKVILYDSIIVFLNGMVSIILTIGMLPFFESTFNIITPLKLLELANPNQPLIKRLLMEAPGTYHHSLMVGNLAEVATEAIGGDALLARIAAYFHDIGKLKRPNFFKENQLSDNPHDRMTANLSTLVITSHTHDGVELAEKYKVPKAIRDIIKQHHGTTLVAYFYHKAKKCEKGEPISQENFRYEGPKPSTKEAAVVMLADSVEAAVRSMIDKTEGKIEGLVRKIIKDKLDDGQLDLCDLTLKDLDIIAKSFMRVVSGYFHEREEYPEIKLRGKQPDRVKEIEAIDRKMEETQQNEEEA